MIQFVAEKQNPRRGPFGDIRKQEKSYNAEKTVKPELPSS